MQDNMQDMMQDIIEETAGEGLGGIVFVLDRFKMWLLGSRSCIIKG
jgi:hypothetical protein